MPTRKTLLALAAAALLAGAVPTTAIGQGAGDDQYVDPFDNDGGGGGGSGGGGSSGSGSGAGSQGSSSGSSGAGDVAGTSSSSGTAGSTAQAGEQLPNTGFAPGLVAAIGASFTLTGFVLRRRA